MRIARLSQMHAAGMTHESALICLLYLIESGRSEQTSESP